jgi:hypothetical protein
MHPDLANIWWFEHLLCLTNVTEDVVSHFASKLPSSPASGMPAPVCCRLNLRFLKTILLSIPIERFELVLELLGFVSGLVKCYPGQFSKECDLQHIAPSPELLAEVFDPSLHACKPAHRATELT